MSADSKVAVVHNGIIHNASDLRKKLEADGVEFLSETDTEVLTHLIAHSEAEKLEDKVRDALRVIEGTYGIAVLHADFPDRIVVALNGSPVVLGIGEKEMFVASDIAALVTHTRQIVTLDDGEMATLKADDFRHLHHRGHPYDGRADHRGVGGGLVRHGRPRHVHAQGDPRAGRGRGPGCCAAASTTGSPPCTSVA